MIDVVYIIYKLAATLRRGTPFPNLPPIYLHTVSYGEPHQSILPLHGEFVDPAVQLVHRHTLGVHDVSMDRLEKLVLQTLFMQVDQRLG